MRFRCYATAGPQNRETDEKDQKGEQLGSDYVGLITKIEEELCAIEGRDGKEAKASSGRKEGVAYCWKNAMGETTAENNMTTSVSRAWRASTTRLRDITKAKDRKTASNTA